MIKKKHSTPQCNKSIQASLHSGQSLAWDHFHGIIADPCGIIADPCGIIADPCSIITDPCSNGRSLMWRLEIVQALMPIVAQLVKHHKTMWNTHTEYQYPMLNSILNADWSNSVPGRQFPEGSATLSRSLRRSAAAQSSMRRRQRCATH